MIKLEDLDHRSQEIFRHIVETYVETGEPIGSKTLTTKLGMSLSSATIRNVMADLETAGLLYAPHTSAGRLPTEAGLRLFVDGILEFGALTLAEQQELENRTQTLNKSVADTLENTTEALCGLSRCAGLVLAPKSEAFLKHVEFVSLAPGRALVILVTEDGLVENRIIEVPLGLPPSSITEAGNYLNSRLSGKTLREAKGQIIREIEANKTHLDQLTAKVVEAGIAMWAGTSASLIIRGQANLLQDVRHMEDLNLVRSLFEALDTQKELVDLLDAVIAADGVQIFIGSESNIFKLSGCSMIVSPYASENGRVVGAIGVIGPARLNYSRIISMVDYTAKLIGKAIG